MAGNTFGKNFKVTTWGESHGTAIGAIIDGCPAGLSLSEEDIQPFLDKRHRKDASSITPKRRESDIVEILSGVFEGKTLGTPISLIIKNTDVDSAAYASLKDVYRPGHADFTFDAKYGHRDYRGGGRSSGRETASRIAAGAIAIKILSQLGITLETKSGAVILPTDRESVGGVAQVSVKNMPAGIGEGVFEKLDALLSQAIMSIGGVKAVEIGAGVKVSSMTGSANNDSFFISDEADLSGEAAKRNEEILSNARKAGSHFVLKQTNNSGGILGGLSDGDEIVIKAHFKPTPSISKPQRTINKYAEEVTLEIDGRHDACIADKGAVACEAMVAITIVDLLFENMHARMDSVEDFYK